MKLNERKKAIFLASAAVFQIKTTVKLLQNKSGKKDKKENHSVPLSVEPC